ncbi:MAG: PQQ-binding-like beta-propeller repeat protein [Eubacterium sp.]
MKKQRWSKIIAVLLLAAVTLFSGLQFGAMDVSASPAGEHPGQVHVVVENTTLTEESASSLGFSSPAWSGTLVDTWVTLTDDTTYGSAVKEALGEYSVTGWDTGYISEVNGLSQDTVTSGDTTYYAGYMTLINDWALNTSISEFKASDGTLKAGDELTVAYSLTMGEDIGSSWNNQDKTVKAVEFSTGELDRTFAADTHEYTLAVHEGTDEIVVTPTASNKNYQVRTSIDGTEYQRTAGLPVADGEVITVKCGDPSWPSMNDNTGEAQTYTFTVKIQKAAAVEDVDSFWPSFRGNDSNTAVRDVKLPKDDTQAELKWAKKFGSGWSAAPSCQIIADDSLIVMTGMKKLYKLSLETGDILAEADMAAAPNWGYTPPAYRSGMIFCPLANGTIQAFSAKTLESLWIYKDPRGGQSLSPIACSDDMIYVGFWRGGSSMNFAAINTTDDDPFSTDEEKTAVWTYTNEQGGFYWAGAAVVGDYVIVGSESDSSGKGHVMSFDKNDGTMISDVEVTGSVRSCMAYDDNSGKVFFTTASGYLCSAYVDSETGTLSALKEVQHEPSSTSTPVVYKGRVYYGAGVLFSSGKIIVADADTLEEIYSMPLQNYPQCSLLLSTAYEEETGYIYLYSTYNARPGGISVMKTKADAASADEATVTELYNAEGYEQYCICSLICGPDGTLYYKNDSCNVLAVSRKQVNLTFDGNGSVSGTAPASVTALVEDVVEAPDNTGDLAKEGYTFDGWNTQADGEGTEYAVGAEVPLTENVTLYAQWKKNEAENPSKTSDTTDNEDASGDTTKPDATKPDTTGTGTKSPNTGDTSDLSVYVLLLIFAGGTAAFLAARRHKA